MNQNITGILSGVKQASRSLSSISDEERVALLMRLADAVDASQEELLAANVADLQRMDPANPLYDRLQLTPDRLTAIAGDI